MAAADFIHKQLISAAGRDALTSIGAFAGGGAAVGAAGALVTGNDTLFGGATSGAMLGAGAGAAARFAGAKYGAGYAKHLEDGGANTGRFDVGMFTKAEKGFNFMSNSEANAAALKKASVPPTPTQAGAGAASVDNPAAAAVRTPGSGATPEELEKNASMKMPSTAMPNENGQMRGGNVRHADMGARRGEAHKQANLANGGADIAASRQRGPAGPSLQERLEAHKQNKAAARAAELEDQKTYGYKDTTKGIMDKAAEYTNFRNALGRAEASNPSIPRSSQGMQTSAELNNAEARSLNEGIRSTFSGGALGPVSPLTGSNALSGSGGPHVTNIRQGLDARPRSALAQGISRAQTPVPAHNFTRGLSESERRSQIAIPGTPGPVTGALGVSTANPYTRPSGQAGAPFQKNALSMGMGF